MKRNYGRISAWVLLALLVVASFTGRLEPVVDTLLGQRLQASNEAYLERALDEAIVGFGVMSAWKAGLDIIEGSEVGATIGVSAQLEVGDIVQPAYDYVDIAWRTLFVGSVALLGLRYLLQAAEMIDAHVMTFALAMACLALLVAWVAPSRIRTREVLRDLVGVGLVAALALFYLLPLSVWGASRLSAVITAPSIEEANAGFASARIQLFPDTPDQGDNWATKLKAIPDRIEQIGTYLKEKSTDMITWTVKLVTGYLFDCLVFPITLFVLLLWLTRSALGYVLHRNMQRTLREDLRAALGGPPGQHE